jgi:dephospho-CoA kinase
MKIIGLTGSIATGKSFVADIFRKNKIPVFSSDQEVGKLLKEKKVIDLIKEQEELFKVIENGVINKEKLSRLVFKDNKILEILEKILHPLVNERREVFTQQNFKEKIALLEIPLLFEKNYQLLCKKIITTYCSDKTQKERALRRANIDLERFNFITKKQIPGGIKATLADYIVYTEISYDYTERQIEQILHKEGIK